MTLADTSVWIRHFRHGDPGLVELLMDGRVLIHPFVLGELACGNLKGRGAVLSDLLTLAAATVAGNGEILQMIEARRLWGKGLGLIDIHLLASALLTGCRLWTLDTRLAKAARELGVD
ncbi:MAG TPA: type II toxin-antitoxin system VapC family toxin [Bryobacteraceae bacterium]|nr:type II toxin-antitoxin system VapC family toxin [Bryobacteraceae bacterium]